MLMDQFRKLLDTLLEMTRVLVTKLRKSFLSLYADKPGERASRLVIPLTFGDAMFALERASHTRKNAGRVKGSSVRSVEQRQQDESEWLSLWEGDRVETSEDGKNVTHQTTAVTTARKRSAGEKNLFHGDWSSEGTACSAEDSIGTEERSQLEPPGMIVQHSLALRGEKKQEPPPTTYRPEKRLKVPARDEVSFFATVCPCPPPLDEPIFVCQFE